jgi:Sec-independent protein translocase protein TatA
MAAIVGPELLLLLLALVVVLVWRGPSALPRLGEAFGKAVKGAREHMPGGANEDADASADPSVTSSASDAPEGEPRSGS